MDFFLSERKESSYVMLLDKMWLILSFDNLNNITIVTGVTLLSVLDVLLLSSYWHNSVKIHLRKARPESKLRRKYVTNVLNEPQHLAKIKTPKRLKISKKGVTNLHERNN